MQAFQRRALVRETERKYTVRSEISVACAFTLVDLVGRARSCACVFFLHENTHAANPKLSALRLCSLVPQRQKEQA